jgi:beta-N-acetylhexosaminidase
MGRPACPRPAHLLWGQHRDSGHSMRISMRKTGLLLAAMVIVGASAAHAQLPLDPAQQAWVDQTIHEMTLEEKLGQLLFPATQGEFLNLESDAFREIKDNVQKYHVGGYIIRGGDPAITYLMVSRMQERARVPLLISADLEGGTGFQFAGGTRFPRAMAIGATGNLQYATDAASFTAREARAMGITVNFYPVADVNNNPANPIINIRSFGENALKVRDFCMAYIKGSQDQRVIATAKHFPGHGDTSVDSHLDLPVINFDRARLNAIELPPFEGAIQANVGAIMTAHIYLPQFEKTPGLPASLSPAITTGLLRQELGFKGIVFTDSLAMHAISQNFGAAQAPLRAIEAGADVALEPQDVPGALAALKAAITKGELSEQRIDESVRRVLAAKAWAGLNTQRTVPFNQIDTAVGGPAAQQKSQEIIEHALTLVKDDSNALPLKLRGDDEVLLVNFVDDNNSENAPTSGLTFRAEFLKRHPRTLFVSVTPATSASEANLIGQLAAAYKTVVVSCSIRIASYKGSLGLGDNQQALLRTFAGHKGAFVFALFGSPYLLNYLPELPSYALAYEFYPGAEAAMVRAIFGEVPFVGRLPVTVGKYPVGFRLEKMDRP